MQCSWEAFWVKWYPMGNIRTFWCVNSIGVLAAQCKLQWRVWNVCLYNTVIFVFYFFQVIAIVMDMFTDVDIFREIVEASTRGIAVYLLLDESNFSHFLKMTEKQGCQVQRLRVRLLLSCAWTFACHSSANQRKDTIIQNLIIKYCFIKLTMKYNLVNSQQNLLYKCYSL